MKRFIMLLLALLAVATLRAEEKTEAAQECKCAEGEENCPCLAQEDQVPSAEKPKGKVVLKTTVSTTKCHKC